MSEDLGAQATSGEDTQLNPTVEAQLRAIDGADLGHRLDSLEAAEPPDAKAGIYIAPLPEIEAVDVEGQMYRFYGARVLPGSHVNPHLHKHGNEPYYFIAGTGGEMNSGRVVDGSVVWDPPKIVDVGSIETVGADQVHCFRNAGQEAFDFAFACPGEHLVDNSEEQPTGDRYFTADLPSGVPPWFTP